MASLIIWSAPGAESNAVMSGRTARAQALSGSAQAYFGVDVCGVVERLLGESLRDGGRNCWTEHGSDRSSFHRTINVLEGLHAYETVGSAPEVRAARRRCEEYLLERSRLGGH